MERRIRDFLDHKLTYREREAFLRDVITDEELGRRYAEILSLRGLESLRSRPEDVQESVAGYRKFIDRTHSRRLRRSVLMTVRYAAAVVLCAAVSWLSITNYRLNNLASAEIAYNTVSVPVGQRVSLTLNDGTVVWLNSMSSLQYPVGFASKERTVQLEGEAYFEVAHDAGRPFVVKGPKVDVKVLGTKFNMQDYANRSAASVSLVEGSVEVSDAAHTFYNILSPNQTLEYTGSRTAISTMPNYDHLLWKEGIYAFDDATLVQIAEMLEVYYDVTIHIKNSVLVQYKYRGKFRQQDGVYEILRILQQFYRFSVERNDSTRTIIIK